MKQSREVYVTFYDGGEVKTEPAIIEYIGHSWEYAPYKHYLPINGAAVEVMENMPMQVVVFVCRVLSTGQVVSVKPEGVRFPAASVMKG